MKKVLTVPALAMITTALLAGLALLAAGTGSDTARANHAVTIGVDLDTTGNTATSLGTIDDCLEVTAGPFDDDGDGDTDEDPIGDANFDGFPGIVGIDDDGDTLIDEDWAGNEPGDPGYTNDLVDDDDEDGSIDEDLPGQMFQFDVYVTDVGHDADPGLKLFTIPVLFDDAVMNIAAIDVLWFLQEGAGSNVLDTSDPQLPDLLDGWVDVGAVDIGVAHEEGTGVLARVTGMTVASGVTTIEMPTVDVNADTLLVPGIDRGPWLKASDDTWISDATGDQFFEGPVIGGTVAVDDTACNPDWDGDGVVNDDDNCPNDYNPPDADGDGSDGEDPIDGIDNDSDTLIDEDHEVGQEDADDDGLGDVCDGDMDGDGYWNNDETAKGSNPIDLSSTPEHCDGVDNDGDTTFDEEPTGANWDIDGDTVKDCLDSDVDTDGDGVVNTVDDDDDGDGFSDAREQYMSTDELGNCRTTSGHDAFPTDANGDGLILVNDIIILFLGRVLNPANYNARADANADGWILTNDIIIFFLGRVFTKCDVFTFTNNTGGAVDDIHIEWSGAILKVMSARDSELEGWSNRTLSGDGLTLDMDRPDAQGDLANGGQLTVVLEEPIAGVVASTCQWTLDGVDQGAC